MSEPNKEKAPARAEKLENVVAEKQPVLHPQQSIEEAGDKMRELGANALPVAEGRHLVGVVEQDNPDRKAAGFGHDPKATLVGEYMNSKVAYCFEDDDCAAALSKMNERQLDRLPVVDREMRIVGVVTRADLEDPESEETTAERRP